MAAGKTKAALPHVMRPTSAAINFIVRPALVKVGTPHTAFHINEELLCSGSEFFKAALKKEWREGQMHVVELPEQKPETFNVYLNWLYQKQVFVGRDADDASLNYPWPNFIEAYALGDLLMDVDFKDAVLDALMVGMYTEAEEEPNYWMPGLPYRKLLYDVTPSGSKAREMLAHYIANGATEKIEHSEGPAMLYDIMQKLAEKNRATSIAAAAQCDFHEHEKGKGNCYRKKFARMFIFDDLW